MMSTKVPPDGGWGWIIVLAYALNGVSSIPIIQGFGLVFKDSFAKFHLTATDTAIIININLAFGMVLGLINGPLLKTFGYRKMAIVGNITYTVGVIMTAFATNFALIMFSYGILASIGMAMSMSSFSLAVNSYFTKKRGRAMGLAMTITGLGSIFIPQVASFLLSYYGIQGTILIFGAYALHSLIGSCLLQPIKWHMKTMPICLETRGTADNENSKTLSNNEEDTLKYNAEDDANIKLSKLTTNHHQRERKLTISSIDHDIEVGSIYGFDVSLPRRLSIDTKTSISHSDISPDIEMTMINGKSMTNLRDSETYLKNPWWNSGRSINSIHLGSSITIFEESDALTKKLTFNSDNNINNKDKISESNTDIVEKESLLKRPADDCSDEKDCDSNDDKKESTISRIMQRIAVIYDLDLFRDPIYINIMLGMSIAIFAEVNFSLLTPFILADMNLTTADIANVMSVIAAVDLVSRGAAPFLGEWMKQSARIMYLFSLCLLIISRFSLIFTNSLTSMLIVAIGLGAAKGIRSVYMTLVIPSYVPIEKLPNASGIQMVTNGLVLTCAGPIIGIIRDNTGSYVPCIILINFITFITITMWMTEAIIVWRKLRREKSKLSEKS